MYVDRQVDDQVALRSPGHFSRTLSHLSKLRREGVLCDVTLLVEGKEFQAHKNVLAACSEYFKAMFTSSITENSKSEFVLETISSEVFEQILEYIYDGCFNIDMITVVDMLHAATLLLMKDIEFECFKYMKRCMNMTNCLRIRSIAEAYCNNDLLKRSTEYIKRNFEKIIKEKEVLSISFKDFKFLLSNDDISCKSEDIVAILVQSWLGLRSDIQLNEVQMLLKCLRLPYLSNDGKSCLESTMKDLDDKKSTKEFTTAFHMELKIQTRSNKRKTIHRRLSQKSENVIFCVSHRGETFCYHPQSKKFRLFERFPEYRQPGHLVVHEDVVYATGGAPFSLFLNPTGKLYSYNITHGRWSTLPAMNIPRSRHCVTILLGKLYVIGGRGGTGADASRSVECFDPLSNTWSHSTSTISVRINSSVTSSDKYLYVMGGLSIDGSVQALNTAERFCPRKETWQSLPNLNHKRVNSAAVFFNGKVFMFGGLDGLFDLNNFEYLDSSEKRWTVVSLHPHTTPITTALCMDDKIIALGGSSNWGQDLVLVNSFVRRRGVSWKVLKDFIHPSHRIKSMQYAVVKMLNYEFDSRGEGHCDCSSFEEESSLQDSMAESFSSDDDFDAWLDEPDPWGIWI